MKTKMITPKELLVLKAIVSSEYQGGSLEYGYNPTDHEVWSWSVNPNRYDSNFRKASLPGVLASLSKKGYVRSNGVAGADATVALTEAGYKVIKPLL